MQSGDMNMAERPVKKYDLKPFGAAIKAVRTECKESHKKVCDAMYLSSRYLANIEKKDSTQACKSSLNLCSGASPWFGP